MFLKKPFEVFSLEYIFLPLSEYGHHCSSVGIAILMIKVMFYRELKGLWIALLLVETGEAHLGLKHDVPEWISFRTPPCFDRLEVMLSPNMFNSLVMPINNLDLF
jgi:hypothetical protein